jgi:hypothetical protein
VPCERDFRALRVEGALPFAAVGVLTSVVQPLAEAQISIFALSTYTTDYVLVQERDLERAVAALRTAGHTVRGYPSSTPA